MGKTLAARHLGLTEPVSVSRQNRSFYMYSVKKLVRSFISSKIVYWTLCNRLAALKNDGTGAPNDRMFPITPESVSDGFLYALEACLVNLKLP